MNALLLLQQVCTVIVQWGTHWLEELFCSALGELLYPPRHGSYGGFEQRLLCTLQPQPSFSPCNTAGMLTTRLPCHVHCWEGLCNNVVDVCVELLRLTSCPVPVDAVTRGRGMRHNLDGNLGASAEEAE